MLPLSEACRSLGIDAETCLRDVLTRLPTLTNRQIKDVTPATWAKAQQTTAQRQAAQQPQSKLNLRPEVLGVMPTLSCSKLR